MLWKFDIIFFGDTCQIKVIRCFLKKTVCRIKAKSRYNGTLEVILKTLIKVSVPKPKCFFYKSPNVIRSCLKIVLVVLSFYVLYHFYRERFLTKSDFCISSMWGHLQIENSIRNASRSFFTGPFKTNPYIYNITNIQYIIHILYIDTNTYTLYRYMNVLFSK